MLKNFILNIHKIFVALTFISGTFFVSYNFYYMPSELASRIIWRYIPLYAIIIITMSFIAIPSYREACKKYVTAPAKNRWSIKSSMTLVILILGLPFGLSFEIEGCLGAYTNYFGEEQVCNATTVTNAYCQIKSYIQSMTVETRDINNRFLEFTYPTSSDCNTFMIANNLIHKQIKPVQKCSPLGCVNSKFLLLSG